MCTIVVGSMGRDAHPAPIAMTTDSEREREPVDSLSTAQRRAIQALIVGTFVVSTAGTAMLPYLLVEHPIALLLTSADMRNIVLLAPRLGPEVLIPLAVVRRIVAMLSTYGFGLLYGRAVLEAAARRFVLAHRLLTWFETVFVRYTAPSLVLWPSYICNTVAGVSRTPLRTFVPWMALGQLGFVLFSLLLGSAATRWTEALTVWLRAHVIEMTVLTVTLVALQQLASHVRRARGVARAQRSQETKEG
jgi:membrane protein DedA with SNARE-associated domain